MNDIIIDLRSDTVTRPSVGMRQAMAAAEVGDDVFREDPTVTELEKKVADLLKKEAGLFVPSGTMGNLISIMSHCSELGSEILIGDKSHIHLYEQGNVAQFGSVHPRTLTNLNDGTFDLQELREKIRTVDVHYPVTRMVAIENSQNKCGGRVLPLNWLKQVGALCKEMNLPLHCDGARLFNSAVALNVSPAELVQDCSSVSVCLSKGLGAPIGSVIVGSKEFIARAIRFRKALGGGMRQVGVLAAAGLYAIENNVQLLKVDHRHAKMIADVVNEQNPKNFLVETIDTNIFLIKVMNGITSPQELVQRLLMVSDHEKKTLGFSAQIRTIVFSEVEIRVTLHLDISEEDVQRTCQKFKFVLDEYARKATMTNRNI